MFISLAIVQIRQLGLRVIHGRTSHNCSVFVSFGEIRYLPQALPHGNSTAMYSCGSVLQHGFKYAFSAVRRL
jgi:hypothetical protein